MRCEQCSGEVLGKGLSNGRFCCKRCQWTWYNANRTLTPNVHYKCIVCGKQVDRYISPSGQGTSNTMEFCGRTCKGKYQTGDKHPRWKGGRNNDGKGYIQVQMPDHPNADSRGRVFEHRLIMERKLERYLKPYEVIHHINDDPSDNRIENLMLFKNNSEHKKFHEKRDKGIRDKKTGQYLKRKKRKT